MSHMKNKVNVDEKLASVIREYYRCTVSTEELNALCFSNPQLQSHCCNALEKLEGGHVCTYCKHDPLKLCEYSCDESKACLAAFAYRLGVAGDKPNTAIKKLLGIPYADLVQSIRTALGDAPKAVPEESTPEPEPEPEAPSEPPKKASAPSPPPKPKAKPKEIVKHDDKAAITLGGDSPTDLMSPKEAAQLWGCTAPNIYAKIKTGKLMAYTQGDSPAKRVSRAAIERLMQKITTS